ncbi:sigma-70 family RNA polymerase sigma factor [Thermanaeromonas sp. C210]|uniref:sigma-70 family RNA polymerase sigma factor n=1 Tax=Thermanaeromonas sp. C210 TaxID=2731925 RepID=UPI00155B84AF|nr:FliA/WhiG family RNA polymerase sigma factor [Thermanaeromonas sp. C210]GFN24129.1 sigma 28, flagella/sporulation [Thermanaeromonas sp. C210]
MAVKDSELWQALINRGEEEARRELALKYLPLVKYIVGRLAVKPPPFLDQEDLIGYGIVGLLEAIDRYDPSRGVNFESFAALRIRGAVLDALRRAHWAPRTLIEKLKQVSSVYRRLEQEQGVEPRDEEVAAAAGLEIGELQDLLERGAQMALISLEEFLLNEEGEETVRRGEVTADPQSPEPEQRVEQEELRRALKQALGGLKERDRLILSLYYYEGLTLKEIGEVLGISESRVCQLHGRAILNLRRLLADYL